MRSFLCILSLFATTSAFAKSPDDSAALLAEQLRQIDSIESSLHYQTGKIVLKGGLATINIAPGFKFLGAAEAKYIIEDVWGNLKGQDPLGLIVLESAGASYSDYAFVVEYESLGYVKDGDAGEINYDDLLKQMKEDEAEANEEREKQGMFTLNLVGWASKPYYDKQSKRLYWAKEFKVQGAEENTLNYDIRLLGRKGVLVLQAVSGMSQLDTVNKHLNTILGMVSFNEGHRYADFDSKTDDVAAWTIGGLVAGKVLAKVGFFAVILKYLKVILLAVGAVGGGVWKWITGRRKKEEDDLVYQPASNPEANA